MTYSIVDTGACRWLIINYSDFFSKTGDCNRRIALSLRRTGSWENFPCLHRLEEGFGGISDDRRTDRYSGHSQQTETRGNGAVKQLRRHSSWRCLGPQKDDNPLKDGSGCCCSSELLLRLLCSPTWVLLHRSLLYSRAGRHQSGGSSSSSSRARRPERVIPCGAEPMRIGQTSDLRRRRTAVVMALQYVQR